MRRTLSETLLVGWRAAVPTPLRAPAADTAPGFQIGCPVFPPLKTGVTGPRPVYNQGHPSCKPAGRGSVGRSLVICARRARAQRRQRRASIRGRPPSPPEGVVANTALAARRAPAAQLFLPESYSGPCTLRFGRLKRQLALAEVILKEGQVQHLGSLSATPTSSTIL
jgi:hypothetical protein